MTTRGLLLSSQKLAIDLCLNQKYAVDTFPEHCVTLHLCLCVPGCLLPLSFLAPSSTPPPNIRHQPTRLHGFTTQKIAIQTELVEFRSVNGKHKWFTKEFSRHFSNHLQHNYL